MRRLRILFSVGQEVYPLLLPLWTSRKLQCHRCPGVNLLELGGQCRMHAQPQAADQGLQGPLLLPMTGHSQYCRDQSPKGTNGDPPGVEAPGGPAKSTLFHTLCRLWSSATSPLPWGSLSSLSSYPLPQHLAVIGGQCPDVVHDVSWQPVAGFGFGWLSYAIGVVLGLALMLLLMQLNLSVRMPPSKHRCPPGRPPSGQCLPS